MVLALNLTKLLYSCIIFKTFKRGIVVKYFLIYFLVISIVSVFITMLDKHLAKHNMWRISEKVLLIFAAFGGGLAMYITMRIIHHKTRKNKFMFGIPAIILLEIGIAAIIYFNFLEKF